MTDIAKEFIKTLTDKYIEVVKKPSVRRNLDPNDAVNFFYCMVRSRQTQDLAYFKPLIQIIREEILEIRPQPCCLMVWCFCELHKLEKSGEITRTDTDISIHKNLRAFLVRVANQAKHLDQRQADFVKEAMWNAEIHNTDIDQMFKAYKLNDSK